MFSKKVIINLQKKDDTIHIEPLGDVHVGHVGFIEDAYEQRIKDIAKDDNRYTLFMGDQLDAINIYDKRYNPEAVVYHDIDAQRQRWQDLSQPLIDEHLTRCEEIKFKQNVYNVKTEDFDKIDRVKYVTKKGENPKVWGLLHGNHEYKIRELTKTYLENNFCFKNGFDFLGAKAYISLDIRYKGKILGQWSIMAMHGSGGGQPETMLKQMKQNNYCDIFFCGHLHQKFYKAENVIDMDHETGKIWQRDIHLANTGTFCEFMTEGVSGYGDTKNQVIGMPIGTATVSINAEQNKVNGHI
mgnify:FL=1|jgi:hypothetical protein